MKRPLLCVPHPGPTADVNSDGPAVSDSAQGSWQRLISPLRRSFWQGREGCAQGSSAEAPSHGRQPPSQFRWPCTAAWAQSSTVLSLRCSDILSQAQCSWPDTRRHPACWLLSLLHSQRRLALQRAQLVVPWPAGPRAQARAGPANKSTQADRASPWLRPLNGCSLCSTRSTGWEHHLRAPSASAMLGQPSLETHLQMAQEISPSCAPAPAGAPCTWQRL